MNYRGTASSLVSEFDDADLKTELISLADDEKDRGQVYALLNFGTAGIRSVVGAGTNRMNL